jgi:hypothetical protein
MRGLEAVGENSGRLGEVTYENLLPIAFSAGSGPFLANVLECCEAGVK